MLKDKGAKTALLSLSFNIPYGAYHVLCGIAEHSWWLFTVGIYYVVLSLMRVTVLVTRRPAVSTAKTTGVLLMLLSFPLAGRVPQEFWVPSVSRQESRSCGLPSLLAP